MPSSEVKIEGEGEDTAKWVFREVTQLLIQQIELDDHHKELRLMKATTATERERERKTIAGGKLIEQLRKHLNKGSIGN